MNTGHGFAFLGAAFARLRAPLAMIHVVFAAFLSTSVAYLRAQAAKLLGKLRVTRHDLSRKHADVRAIPVEPDATFHHLHVVLLQTSGRAVFALLGALQARLDTTSIFFVSHIISPFLERRSAHVTAFQPTISTGCLFHGKDGYFTLPTTIGSTSLAGAFALDRGGSQLLWACSSELRRSPPGTCPRTRQGRAACAGLRVFPQGPSSPG